MDRVRQEIDAQFAALDIPQSQRCRELDRADPARLIEAVAIPVIDQGPHAGCRFCPPDPRTNASQAKIRRLRRSTIDETPY